MFYFCSPYNTENKNRTNTVNEILMRRDALVAYGDHPVHPRRKIEIMGRHQSGQSRRLDQLRQSIKDVI